MLSLSRKLRFKISSWAGYQDAARWFSRSPESSACWSCRASAPGFGHYPNSSGMYFLRRLQRWHFGLLKHPAVKRFKVRELDLRIVMWDQFPSQKLSRSSMSRGSPNLSNNSAIRTILILSGVLIRRSERTFHMTFRHYSVVSPKERNKLWWFRVYPISTSSLDLSLQSLKPPV